MMRIRKKLNKTNRFFAGLFGLMALGTLLLMQAAGGARALVGWMGLVLVVCFVMFVAAFYAAHRQWPSPVAQRVFRVLCWLAAGGSGLVMLACALLLLLR
jgi:hypothetical protein